MRIIILFLLLISIPAAADGDEFTLEWDYDTNTTIDGFRIFSGPMGQLEDGSWYPKLNDTPLVDDISPGSRQITVIEDGWEGVKKKYCFIARAFKGSEESPDSNYVCADINNLPLAAPLNLSGQYDQEQEIITITWDQEDKDRLKFWRVYYKLQDAQFVMLAEIPYEDQTEYIASSPFTAVAQGQSADVEFAVVAFKNEKVFSANSEAIVVSVDRAPDDEIPAPNDLKFSVIIPVLSD